MNTLSSRFNDVQEGTVLISRENNHTEVTLRTLSCLRWSSHAWAHVDSGGSCLSPNSPLSFE